jgi:hypothetical protein
VPTAIRCGRDSAKQRADVLDRPSTGAPRKTPTELSELQKFARSFTANWRVRASSFLVLANEYIQQLPLDRKEVLAKEFRAFLYESNTDSDKALLQRWYRQGAEVWDFDLTVHPVMSDFYWMMNPNAPKFELPTPRPVGRGQVFIGRSTTSQVSFTSDLDLLCSDMIRSPVLLGRDCPIRRQAIAAQPSGPREARSRARESPRAGLDGENDGVKSEDSASPPFFGLSRPSI